MKFIDLFKKKAQPEVIEATIVEPLIPMVTTVDEDGSAKVFSGDAEEWVLSRSGDLVYLSGEDGLVQAQFRTDDFRGFLAEAQRIVG